MFVRIGLWGLVITTVVAAICSGVLKVRHAYADKGHLAADAPSSVERSGTRTVTKSVSDVKVRDSEQLATFIGDEKNIPPECLDFFMKATWDQCEVLRSIDALGVHSDQIVAFMRRAIANKTLEPVVRNLMANFLLRMEPQGKSLSLLFMGMIEDAAESMQWREYAIQHLAQAVQSSTNGTEIVAKLRMLMKSSGASLPGTAMLQLHRLEQESVITLDDTFSSDVLAILDDPRQDILTRITCLSLINERKISAAHERVREIAGCTDATMKRVALAALGAIGNRTDMEFLRLQTQDANPGIRNAAEGALQRLAAAEF